MCQQRLQDNTKQRRGSSLTLLRFYEMDENGGMFTALEFPQNVINNGTEIETK